MGERPTRVTIVGGGVAALEAMGLGTTLARGDGLAVELATELSLEGYRLSSAAR